MKAAHQFLEELAALVQPPQGCRIVLLEVEPRPSHDFNWLAAVGENQGANHRYESAIVDLRRRHSRLNWEDVTREGKWRRIAR